MSIHILPPSVVSGHRELNRTTEKFGFIDTLALMPALEAAGYAITQSSQVKRRKNSTRDPLAAKHLLRLRQQNIKPLVGDVFPEIVVVNAHDGSSAFRLMLGLFRLACANGLIVQSMEFAPPVRLTHAQSNVAKVMDLVKTLQNQAQEAGQLIRNMQERTLNNQERLTFATEANRIMTTPLTDAARLLEARRITDQTQDLWTVFNVVQENMSKGGILQVHQRHHSRRYTHRHTRPIRAIDATLSMNTKLWSIASTYIPSGVSV